VAGQDLPDAVGGLPGGVAEQPAETHPACSATSSTNPSRCSIAVAIRAAISGVAYLDTTGGFGVLARDALIADAVTRIAADPRITDDDGATSTPAMP
jgi:hypothetical protein